MPDLPTLTVTTAQANRMIAAWGTVDQYRQWLREQIIQYVLRYEADLRFATWSTQEDAIAALARQELGG